MGGVTHRVLRDVDSLRPDGGAVFLIDGCRDRRGSLNRGRARRVDAAR